LGRCLQYRPKWWTVFSFAGGYKPAMRCESSWASLSHLCFGVGEVCGVECRYGCRYDSRYDVRYEWWYGHETTWGFFCFLFIIIYITNFAPVCIGMVGFGRVGTLQGGSIGARSRAKSSLEPVHFYTVFTA
jgi:hypothetical protein